MPAVKVFRGRTTVLTVSLPYDVSNDIITSDIRRGRSSSSELIAMWMVEFKTDGTDGELVLTIDDEVTSGITANTGYMDLKRITAGEPVPVFDEVLEVVFKDVVTA